MSFYNSRIDLIEAFMDTRRRIWEDDRLKRLTKTMQSGTILYFGDYEAVNPPIKSEKADILITEDTTFHCARSFLNGEDRLCVLNFANAYSPGGGVENGAMAQEECLCRSSNLYSALTMPYLLKNYYKWNAKNTGDMGSDSVIYSPDVTVFKTDDAIPQKLDCWFKVDVLTCAAPYYNPDKKKPVTMEKLEEVFRIRIRNILEVAASKEADILILGAFGCGAFNNPPELVSGVFRQLLIDKGYGRFFKKVVFAIKKNNAANTNLEAFRRTFEKI